MALKMSTGLCNKLHVTNTTRLIFDLCFLKIYQGAAPANADAAASGAPIVVVSNNGGGGGLTFDPTASGGTLAKKTGETWSGSVAAGGGTATHFRLCAAGDTGVYSITEARVQGSVGTGGTDMVVGNPVLQAGALFTVNFATLSFVPS